jgi:hypothetical protein
MMGQMMSGAGMTGWMGLSMLVWGLLGIALLVLTVLAVIRFWPGKRTN